MPIRSAQVPPANDLASKKKKKKILESNIRLNRGDFAASPLGMTGSSFAAADSPSLAPVGSPEGYGIDTRPPSYFDIFNDEMYNNQDSIVIAHPEQNMAVVATLVALILILCVILGFVALPPFVHIIRRKMPVSQARINKRYATVDGWLITKVSTLRLVFELVTCTF